MLNSKQIHDMEQATAAISEIFPPMWRGLYMGLLEQGFSETESMDLLKHYIKVALGSQGKSP